LVVLFFSFVALSLFLAGFWIGIQRDHAGVVAAEFATIKPGSPHVILLNVTAETVALRGAVYSIDRRVNVTYEILYAGATPLQPPSYEGVQYFVSEKKPLHLLDWAPPRLGVYFLLFRTDELTDVGYWMTFASPRLSGPRAELLTALWAGAFLASLGVVASLPLLRIHHWHIGVALMVLSIGYLLSCVRWYRTLHSTEFELFPLLLITLLLIGAVVFASDFRDFRSFVRTKGKHCF